MKYLVNRDTKEHREYTGSMADQQLVGTLPDEWEVIEADPEGWIKHGGGECPLPPDVMCQWRSVSRGPFEPERAGLISWVNGMSIITHYRPILDDNAVKSAHFPNEPESIEVASPQDNYDPIETLIPRLQSAHKAASELPDIIAELREVLEPIGYDLVARDPFVEPEYQSDTQKLKVPPELQFTASCILCGSTKDDAHSIDCPNNKPEPDMTDWRNWREGDLVEKVKKLPNHNQYYQKGKLFTVGTDKRGDFGVIDCDGVVCTTGILGGKFFEPDCFRFHSRPTKEQDK